MLQDVLNSRPTEIDSINGAIVAEGRRVGVAVPVNETIWRLIKGFADEDSVSDFIASSADRCAESE
jgi:2-dehydropantoate 2-reductase